MRVTIGLCLLAALAASQDEVVFGKKPYVVKSIECEVLIPNGWQAMQNHVGMIAQVARNPQGMGMRITRQPMHGDAKTFGESWSHELAKGGIMAKVSKRRAGKYAAWSATWKSDAAGGRTIEAWRVHAPENEMIYNIAFSLPQDASGKELFKGIARSFKCTAGKANLEFQSTSISIGARTTLTLPKGFNKREGRGMPGGAVYAETYLLSAPGTTPPRVAGRIGIQGVRGFPIGLWNRSVARNPEDLVIAYWVEENKRLGGARGGRVKAARIGPYKGSSAQATGIVAGIPKEVFIFAGKLKQQGVVITIVVDARLARMYKSYFKQVCSKLKPAR